MITRKASPASLRSARRSSRDIERPQLATGEPRHLKPRQMLRSWRSAMAHEQPARELTVGEVARRAGVRVSTLHFYEAQGLIQSRRTERNQRRYPRSVLRLIAVIKVAQRSGIPLTQIREKLAMLPSHRPVTVAEWSALSSAWGEVL